MTEGGDWRARKKAATKHAIQEHALRLFVEKGYDATTVEEIAAAAGVSHMTFFRYFPRKEEVVEYDEYDPLLEELVAARPADEPPLTALHRAIRTGLAQILATDHKALRIRTRLVLQNPVLRLTKPTRAGHFSRTAGPGAGSPCRPVRTRPRRNGSGVRCARRHRAGGDGVGGERQCGLHRTDR